MNQFLKAFLAIFLSLSLSGCAVPQPKTNNTAPAADVSMDTTVSLAKALTTAGVKIYGSEFCSACKYQKQMFGEAWRFITYINCDISATSGVQTAACRAKGITLYPTWEFQDGSRLEGVQQFKTLAQKIGFDLKLPAPTSQN